MSRRQPFKLPHESLAHSTRLHPPYNLKPLTLALWRLRRVETHFLHEDGG